MVATAHIAAARVDHRRLAMTKFSKSTLLTGNRQGGTKLWMAVFSSTTWVLAMRLLTKNFESLTLSAASVPGDHDRAERNSVLDFGLRRCRWCWYGAVPPAEGRHARWWCLRRRTWRGLRAYDGHVQRWQGWWRIRRWSARHELCWTTSVYSCT